jgi:hypothetical protein
MTKPTWEMYDISDENQEHDLYDSVIVEFNDISGTKIDYYILNPSISYDTLYGESTEVNYLGPYETKVVYEVTEEVTMTNVFGIVSEEMIQYAEMPKTTFSRDVSANYVPRPGDVIVTKWNERAYEIVDVGEEAKIFQLMKLAYEFILKPFRFSGTDEIRLSDATLTVDIDETLTDPLTAYGDNIWIEDEADSIATVSDSDVYGY